MEQERKKEKEELRKSSMKPPMMRSPPTTTARRGANFAVFVVEAVTDKTGGNSHPWYVPVGGVASANEMAANMVPIARSAVPGTGTPGFVKCHANREQSSWVSWSPIEALRNPITFDQSKRSFGCALQPLPFTLKH